MKVFISYHLADSKYRVKLESMLKENGIDYYAVPEDADFNGWHNQHISQFLIDKLKDCDVTLCIIGKETYSRPHIDHELNATLKGDFCERKGLVGIMLENRKDSKNKIDLSIFPTRIQDNLNYAVLEQWATINKRLKEAIKMANDNRCKKIPVNNTQPLMQLKDKKYYNN